MTHAEFHRRLLKLVKAAKHDGLCPGCISLELIAALEAVIFVSGMSSADLEAHNIDTLELPGATGPLSNVTRH